VTIHPARTLTFAALAFIVECRYSWVKITVSVSGPSPMSLLFSPLTLRDVTLRNRTVIAPMCQYTAQHGFANDWHLVHLGRFAIGGFGLVILEATGVTPEGRISYADLGLWEDAQIAPLARIVDFLHQEGAAAGIQLAHAGRKASTPVSWSNIAEMTEEERQAVAYEAWTPVAPSAIIHSATTPGFTTPRAMTLDDIKAAVEAFAEAARRADEAGFDVVEIHAAHGYLINQFLSPIANHRTDEYGGSRDNRMRFALEVTDAVRAAWPADKPLLVRISATDAAEGGWDVEDSVVLANALKARGVDVIHVSSGGVSSYALQAAPLYQVGLSKAVRAAGLPTVAVGLINEPADAERVLRDGEADLVAFARGALEDPNWAIHANHLLDGAEYNLWPKQARERIRSKDRVLGIRQPA
jgi:2,4-dienoyl-CoA reductase-like NADH-dependent reductase (Old Yellow Enzyme family)